MAQYDDVRGDTCWRNFLRVCAVIVGLGGILAGPFLLFFLTNPHVGWAAMIAGLIFMVSSRFDDVVEIGFGTFKTKLERRVRDVEEAMDAVRLLAKESARSSLNSVQYMGRWGGFSQADKLKFLRDTRQLLTELGVSQRDISEIEGEWHRAVEFDYAHWALGGTQLPKDLPSEFHDKYRTLAGTGISLRPEPSEIRAFFREADMMTDEREKILQDYEHYISRREHRREEEWLRHQEQP